MTKNSLKLTTQISFLILTVFLVLCVYACSKSDSQDSSTQSSNAISTFDPNLLIDSRDNQSYKIIQLSDGNTWMAQNLNFKSKNSWLSNNDENNAQKYGRLYNWESANSACPKGWRLPSDKEWNYLAMNYGTSEKIWYDSTDISLDSNKKPNESLNKNETNSFPRTLGGYRNADGSYEDLEKGGYYWSSSEESEKGGWYYYFVKSKPSRFIRNYWDKRWGYSCRCIKN